MSLSGDCDLLCISCHSPGGSIPFTALLHEASIPVGHYPNKQALTLNAYWSQTDEFSVSACVARLCVSQAAADNPHVRYHYRSNAEYNQVFHFVISLFDW